MAFVHGSGRRRFEAVVIGTSAGGVQALSTLLPAFSPGAGVAVLVVLHLPRDRRSLLVEVFQARCRFPVVIADDKMPVTPGTVFFAPPDYHLLVEPGGLIALSVDPPVHHSRPSIDVLFESAADAYRGALMGLVLTGSNPDGAAGLAAIDRAGGCTVVQDPATAEARWMPEAALRRVTADHVLPLDKIASMLEALNRMDAA